MTRTMERDLEAFGFDPRPPKRARLMDIFHQDRRTWRYVAMKGINNLVPAISVIVAAQYGLVAGAATLSLQLIFGAMTDLTFFNAITHANGNGGSR